MEVEQRVSGINPDIIRALRHYVVRDEDLWKEVTLSSIYLSSQNQYMANLEDDEGYLVDVLRWLPDPIRKWEHAPASKNCLQ